MFDLKPLHREAIPRAMEKAERYRLLNEAEEAESICLDVLRVEPENQEALVTLLLSLTDQFGADSPECVTRARDVLPRLAGEYDRLYYAGIICERRGSSRLNRGGHGSGYVAFDWFRQAMDFYAKAEAVRPAGNDDALLRWNTCARVIMRNHLEPGPQDNRQPDHD